MAATTATTTATATAVQKPQPPVSLAENAQNGLEPVAGQDASLSARSESTSEEDEEALDIDQDDAQSIILPALSPAATRLISPRTPATEKAAVMEGLPGGGLFRVVESTTAARKPGLLAVPAAPEAAPESAPESASATANATSPKSRTKLQNRHMRGLSMGNLPSSLQQASKFQLPSPWQSGPKELVVPEDTGPKSALSSVFDQAKARRSSIGGSDTLKRIRGALPTISLPLFFSSPVLGKSQAADARSPSSPEGGVSNSRQVPATRAPAPSSPPAINQERTPSVRLFDTFGVPDRTVEAHSSSQQPMTLPIRPRAPRRSTSDDSLLYHSLSRVSSLGDDDRWNNIRGQKNSRLKAITDSWDRPTFKLPQLPKQLKRHSLFLSESLQGSDGNLPATIPESDAASKDSPLSELDRALETLTGDIVIMGGYRGSVLRSTRTNRQVWVPVKVGLNIRKVNLEVGLDPEDEERMEETIYPSGMLKNIGPVDISKKLFRRLRECDNGRAGRLRVWDYGYDWRLSPHLLSRRLNAFLEKLPSNQPGVAPAERGALVIAHSLGGLITRHALNQRPELYSGAIFAGTPQRCINILGPLRNGDAVLLNEKVLTAQVNFSLRTSFVFLPEDGRCFVNKHTGEEFPVDFYDPAEWARYSLSPCIEPPLPPFNARSLSFGGYGSVGSVGGLGGGGALGSLKELSGRIPAPLRSRGNSAASDTRPAQQSPTTTGQSPLAEAARRAEVANDRTLAPQMGTLSGGSNQAQQQHQAPSLSSSQPSPGSPTSGFPPDAASSSAPGSGGGASRARNAAYLARVLSETRRFRAEAAHRPELTRANAYPPLGVIYGKQSPTVSGAHVASREAIACSDAYDNLVFGSGDGVVLAREAQLPPGYDVVRGGRVSTDRGHITMLGDLEAVGRALAAVARGRRKGIGLGTAAARRGRESVGKVGGSKVDDPRAGAAAATGSPRLSSSSEDTEPAAPLPALSGPLHAA